MLDQNQEAICGVQIPGDNPAQALVLAKQVTVMVYEGARKLYGDLSPVLVPPRCTPSPLPCFLVACCVPFAALQTVHATMELLDTQKFCLLFLLGSFVCKHL